jgi:phosphatidyl-myo-inositol dimannoside synthase
VRVLYVSHSYPPRGRPLANVGGMQRVAVELGNALAAHPEVELSTLCLRTSWRSTGIRTPPFLLSLLRRVPAIVAGERIQVVLFSSMVTAAVTPFLLRSIHRAGAIAAAITVGRDVTLPNPLYQRYVSRVLRALDLVLPISRATAAECVKRGAPVEKVSVVPCGIDLRASSSGAGDRAGVAEERATDAGRSRARAALLTALGGAAFDLAPDALLLLSVGRHQERKGFHWFVDEVMPRLEDRFVYLLAGEGPMTAEIRERVARRRLERRVRMLGKVAESLLAELYRGSDLFIMPNLAVQGDIEGFGVVMLEAGATGLPVIAADLEGIRDVVVPGVNGSLIPSGDAEAFAREIRRYESPALRQEAGIRAAEYVCTTFGWETVAEAYLRVIRTRLPGSQVHGSGAEIARQARRS